MYKKMKATNVKNVKTNIFNWKEVNMENNIFKAMSELFSGDIKEDLKKLSKIQIETVDSTIETAKKNLNKLGKLEEELKTDTVKESLRNSMNELAAQIMQLDESKEKLEETYKKYGF